MKDHTMNKLLGILCDVLVRVAYFIFLDDFFILDFEVPIIFKKPFVVTGNALVDMKIAQMKFCLNHEVGYH